MNRKLIITGMILLALVLTSGTFAYTYSGFSMNTLDSAAATETFTTHEPSADQPDWDDVLPWGEPDQEMLMPSGAGDQTRIPRQYPEEGENWDKIDEMSADDWETYVYSTSKGYKQDLYNLADHVDGEGEIAGVTVYFRFSGEPDGNGTGKAKAVIKTHSRVYEGNEETQPGPEFDGRAYQWTTNPKTGENWTWDEIDALQAGVALKRASCTQVFVMVDYLVMITQGEVPEGDLFEITPHETYTGDLLVKIYLTNTSDLIKAYQYVNMKLYVEYSLEAEKTPDYQILSVENGVVLFNIEGGSAASYTIELTGGAYRLISDDPYNWGEDWSVAPELYCEVSQR